MRKTKLTLRIVQAMTLMIGAFASFTLHAESSETIFARKGLFRLMSADINEKDAYHFKTSVQYFQQADLLKDTDESTVRSTQAMLAFGYALLPQVHLSAHGGFRLSTREPQVVTSNPLSGGSEAYETVKGGVAATGTYDLGRRMNIKPGRFLIGLSVWINLEKVTRFFSGPDVIPTLILTGDFSDAELFPFRTHLNVGYRLANAKRYFDDSDTAVNDFDRFSTETIKSQAYIVATGIEFPFRDVNPSLEVHMHKVQDATFMQSPKWVTLGLKGKPFTQKNIEIFGAVDLGLSTFKASTTSVPKVPAVPLWNAVVGFGISQFGRRAGEVGVDQKEYDSVRQSLTEKEKMIAGLQRDLEYNTIQGRVIDAETKKPLAGVKIALPENSEFKPSETGDDGRFVRYFRTLPGARVLFSKDGFESSSKFLSLRPGERVTVDIEMRKATGQNLADFVASVADEEGKPVAGARFSLRNIETGELSVVNADPQGQISVKVPEGRYLVEIRAPGYKPMGDQVEFSRGKTVLRNFNLTR